MTGTSTPNLQLYKPDPDDNVNVVTDLNNNWDKVDSAVPGHARYTRNSGDGALTLAGGDQIVSFPSTAKSSPLVTPQGSPFSSWLCQAGIWLISTSARLSVAADVDLYISTGTSFSEANSLGFGTSVSVKFNVAASDIFEFDVATSVCIGAFRGGVATNIINFGLGATHVSFTRIGLG